MPLTLSCACGRQLRAPDEYAGRRIKCPGCGEVLTVPASSSKLGPATPTPRPSLARSADSGSLDPGAVRFICGRCGKQLQARAEHAGQLTRCPDCNARLPIPGPDGTVPPLPRHEEEERRVTRAPAPAPEPAPRQEKGRGRSLLPLLLLLGPLLLLLAGSLGLGAWWFFSGRPVSDTAFVPGTAQAFVTLRVAEAWAPTLRAAVEQYQKENPGGDDPGGLVEAEIGLPPWDIERLTVVALDPDRELVWVVVTATKPYSRGRIEGILRNPTRLTHEGQEVVVGTTPAGAPRALHFAGDRVFVLGPELGVKRAVSTARENRVHGPLDDALRLAKEGKHDVVAGINLTDEAGEKVRLRLAPAGPEARTLAAVLGGTVTVDLREGAEARGTFRYPSAREAEEAREAALRLRDETLNHLPLAALFMGKKRASAAESVLKSLKVERTGAELMTTARADVEALAQGLAFALPLMRNLAAGGERAVHLKNLDRIVRAMHAYAAEHGGRLPAAGVIPKGAREPLYSWRVELLPYLGAKDLYDKFHKNERWDSKHNLSLLSHMPAVYALPDSASNPGAGMTPYQVITGPGTPFDGPGITYPGGFTDGPDKTILVVEAHRLVKWTEPADVIYTPVSSLKPKLGVRFGSFYVALADGTVRPVAATVSDTTLHAAVTPAGNDELGKDWANR